MTPLLEIKKIVKNFGGLRATDELDFHVNEGEVVTLIGGPSTKTIKTDTAFAEFTDLPAGQYTVTVAYDDHADAALESTISVNSRHRRRDMR